MKVFHCKKIILVIWAAGTLIHEVDGFNLDCHSVKLSIMGVKGTPNIDIKKG